MIDEFICERNVNGKVLRIENVFAIVNFSTLWFDTNSIDLNPKKCFCLESKRGLAAAKPTCSFLAKHAQTSRQLSARTTVNSFVKSDRRSHHFIGPLIRIDPFKSSARLNERVPLSSGLKNPGLLVTMLVHELDNRVSNDSRDYNFRNCFSIF